MTREVFALDVPKKVTLDPERVFYTIRDEDVRKSLIRTTAGIINMSDFMGPVQKQDVGKRIFRTLTDAKDSYVWHLESDEERDKRLLEAGDPVAYARAHTTSPATHALLDEVERGRERRGLR